MPELTLSQEEDLCVELTFKGQTCDFLQNFFRRKTPRPPPPTLQIHMQIPTVKCSYSGIYLSPNTIFFSGLCDLLISAPLPVPHVNNGTRKPLETTA